LFYSNPQIYIDNNCILIFSVLCNLLGDNFALMAISKPKNAAIKQKLY